MKRALLVFLTLSFVACAQKREDIINVSAADAEMNAAISEAQRTLSDFWQRRDKEGEEFSGILKVYFTDPGSKADGEHMWVRVTSRSENEITGMLLDEPGWLKSVKSGQKVRFPLGQITDWLYIENGKARGAFTVRLLRKRMSPEERQKHDSGYPFTFD